MVLAEDDVLLREGLASLLERSGLTVLGQAGDGAELLELARRTKPDIVVADVRMPPTHTTEGLEAARQLRKELPEVGILVLSAYADVDQAMELLAGGRCRRWTGPRPSEPAPPARASSARPADRRAAGR